MDRGGGGTADASLHEPRNHGFRASRIEIIIARRALRRTYTSLRPAPRIQYAAFMIKLRPIFARGSRTLAEKRERPSILRTEIVNQRLSRLSGVDESLLKSAVD